jgi:hypothetical protein
MMQTQSVTADAMNSIARWMVAVALLCTSVAWAEQPSFAGQMRRDISRLSKPEKTSDARDAALSICNAIRHRQPDQTFPVELVPVLDGALDNKDNGVRYFSVRSLALIGPEANGSLPALRRLLDQEKHPLKGTLMFGISPAPQIENAIAVIEGRSTQVRQAVSDQCD